MGQAPDASCVVTAVRVTFSKLLADPTGDGVVVRHVHGAHQVQDEFRRVVHLEGVLTERPHGDDEA